MKNDKETLQALEYATNFDLTEPHLTLLRSSVVIWNDIEAGAPAVLYSPQLLDSPSIPYLDVGARAGIPTCAPPTAAQIAEVESLVAGLPEALRQLLERGSLQPGPHSYVNPLAGWREDLAPRAQAELGRKPTVELEYTARHATLLRHLSWRGLAVDAKRPYGEFTYFELEMAEILGEASDSAQAAEDDERLSAAQEKELRRQHAETLAALQIFLREARVAAGQYPRIGGPVRRPGTWDGEGYFQPYAQCGGLRLR